MGTVSLESHVRKPSVLMLLPDLPMPASSGGQVRAYHFLLGLTEVAHVTACLFPSASQGCLPEDVRLKCDRVVQPVAENAERHRSTDNGWWLACRNLLTSWREHGRSLMLAGSSLCAGRAERSVLGISHRFYAFALIFVASLLRRCCDIDPADVHHRASGLDQIWPRMLQHFRDVPPDIIWCEHTYLYPVCERLSVRFPQSRIVVNAHNVESQLKASIAATMTSWAGRTWLEFESRLMEQWERRMLQRATLIFCCSSQDVDRFRTMEPDCQAVLSVIPNGADTQHFAMLPQSRQQSTLLFMGTAGYPPNDDAVNWLMHEIMPRIREKLPASALILAGRNAEHCWGHYRQLDPQLKIESDVPDMRPCLNTATLCVVPLRSGSGTRLKILEAMSAGRPVVSTRIGAEGMDVVAGQHLLLADAACGFADAVVRLLGNPVQQAELIAAGRQLVIENYDWTHLIARAMHQLRFCAK